MLKFVLFRTKHVSYRSRPSTRNNNSILFYKLKLDKKRPPETELNPHQKKCKILLRNTKILQTRSRQGEGKNPPGKGEDYDKIDYGRVKFRTGSVTDRQLDPEIYFEK